MSTTRCFSAGRAFIATLLGMTLTVPAGAAQDAMDGRSDAPMPAGAHMPMEQGAMPDRKPEPQEARRDGAVRPAAQRPKETLPNLTARAGWPEPVADSMPFGLLLFDLLEYRAGAGGDYARWDILGWRGGDYRRIWFKSEGARNFGKSGGDAEVQVLYGRLIAPFFDFQAGLRYDRRWGPEGSRGRALAAIGLQGLAPYRFEIEPTVFLSQNGDISARFTATQDILITQRLIVQPRIESNAAVQSVKAFGVGKGINDVELGLRLRYEISREIAPYVGVTWKRSMGQTADFLRNEGQRAETWQAVAGFRLWF